MTPFLQTERLVLRRFTPDDAPLLVELDGDPAVMRFLSGGEGTAAEEVRDSVLPGILRAYERWDGRRGVFAAEEQGVFVGWFLLRPEAGAPLSDVELGYRLRRAAWGRGLATEGSRALVDLAFSALGVQRVWAATMALNTASQRVLEKVGLTVVSTLETPEDMSAVEGAELGGLLYEVTAEQWRGRTSRADG